MLPLQCWLSGGVFCPGQHVHPGVSLIKQPSEGFILKLHVSLEWVEVLWTRISGKDGIRIMVMVAVVGCDACWLCSPGWRQRLFRVRHFAGTEGTVVDVSLVCCVEACVSKLASTVSLARKFWDPLSVRAGFTQNVMSIPPPAMFCLYIVTWAVARKQSYVAHSVMECFVRIYCWDLKSSVQGLISSWKERASERREKIFGESPSRFRCFYFSFPVADVSRSRGRPVLQLCFSFLLISSSFIT